MDVTGTPPRRTRRDLLRAVAQAELGMAQSTGPIKRLSRQVAPLSHSQTRLWFLQQFEPESSAYNVSLALRANGSLDLSALSATVSEIVRRHEVLRTTFEMADGEPVQRIHPAAEVPLPVTDLQSLDPEEREREARRRIAEEAQRPFDLAVGPLFRVSLLRLSENEHAILITTHHIACDGWSKGRLFGELTKLYNAFIKGEASPLPELPIQYADFAAWQQTPRQQDVLKKQVDYWVRQLAEAPALLELPTDRPRPPVQTFNGTTRRHTVPTSILDSLKEVAQSEGATLFMALLAAYQILLFRYSGQNDVVVGTPIANRTRPELEGLVGFFTNTLALRGDLSGDPNFRELLARARETALGAYSHQDVPFEKLVEELRPERSMSHPPICQVMISLQNAPRNSIRLEGLELAWITDESTTSKFDLLFAFVEVKEGLRVTLEYNTDLFDADRMERMLGHFQTLLEGIVANPNGRISDLPLLTEPERQQIVLEWNDTQTEYPKGRCIHTLFEEQVARTPDSIAVIFGDHSVTYSELNSRSNQLAHYLKKQGVGRETLVGLCLERSINMIVGMLGILKAGGAYLPLDPSHPSDRLAFMLKDAGATLLVSDRSSLSALPDSSDRVVWLDEDNVSIGAESAENPVSVSCSEDLIYVMYTSGSTGIPKGIEIPHRSVSRLLCNTDYVSLGPDRTFAQLANAAFDASTWEIWGALLFGARLLILARDETLSPEALSQRLNEGGARELFLTTALFNQIAEHAPEAFDGLEDLLFGGERVDTLRVRALLERRCKVGLGPKRLLHVYGPTESTTYASWYLIEQVAEDEGTVPIGRPLANTRIYLLDSRLQPSPVGVAGEVYIGGDGLARGYLCRPDLTAEKFIPDPFSEEAGGRLYRTGDLARYRSDGSIEFLGRTDHQVKVRGFRIELGEIESVIVEHPEVVETVVVALEDAGDKRLVAYLVKTEGSALDARDLREHLRAKLPGYMVPSAFVFLEAFALNANKKIDRSKLPDPELGSAAGGEGYVEPRTATEAALAQIWQEILKVGEVGVHDSFFDLGGHSLMATQVVSRVRSIFQFSLPLRALFESPTVALLAERIAEAGGSSEDDIPPLTRASRDGTLPLSFAQQRLWFIHQMDPEGSAYNMPAALRLDGALDRDALQKALEETVRRHEVLRTTFDIVNGAPVQVIHPAAALPFPVVDLSHLADSARSEEAHRLTDEEARRPFDLEFGPVFRVTLLKLAEDEHILLLCMHHIVSDGWSQGVLTREFVALYNAFRLGQLSPLPEPAIQYADYAVWQRGWLQGEALQRQLSYWTEHLANAPAALDLPTDRPRPAVQTFAGQSRSIRIPGEIVGSLRELSKREGATLFMTMLAAYQVLLCRYSGQDDIIVGTPIANRTHGEVENLIGFFVNTLALRGDLSGDPTFTELLARAREVSLGAFAHQDLPFEKLVEELLPERSLSSFQSPLFQTVFVLQNAPRTAMDFEGLHVSNAEARRVTAKFDLLLAIFEGKNAFNAVLEYSTDLFDSDRMERLLGHYVTLLEALVKNPDQRISRLPLLTQTEREEIITGSVKSIPFSAELCLHEIFERQVAQTPDSTALACEGYPSLTYAELNARANRVASTLRARKIVPDTLVGLCVDRSPEMVIGVLGILKAGGAYLPLDPSYPAERLAYMLEDAKAPVVLTKSSLIDSVPSSNAVVLCIDDPEIDKAPTSNLPKTTTPENLAYVIYTSGSTGRPKGAQITHSNVVRLMAATEDWFHFDEKDVWTLFHSLAFDFSVWELWGPLLYGGKLVVVGHLTSRSPDAFYQLLVDQKVTILNQTPSAFRQLLAMIPTDCTKDRLPIRKIIFGGEALEPASLQRWYDLFGEDDERLINMYGITETTVHVTYRPMVHGDLLSGNGSVIGCAIPDLQVYVLDSSLEPVPVGVAGEMFVGGAGLARGYLNRPDLTADRFIPDAFSGQPGARLYRTGDLARFLANGDLEYLGRIDQQVKIRGFRIELGEIESVLTQHPAVRETVLLAREDNPGDKRLTAYVVPDPQAWTAQEDRAENEAEQTSEWQEIFDANYSDPNPEDDPTFNIRGWNSSYTGQPIPAEEMREWLESTVERIMALEPKRVVEIGCGTGMLLYRVAPHCVEYTATDFSQQALDYVQRVLGSRQDPLSQVRLQQAGADEFAVVGEHAPDTVIVNSVAQYFASIEYFRRMVERAVETVADDGRIFLGDLRQLDTLEAFQAAVQLSHATPGQAQDMLRRKVEQAVSEEDELLIDPAFFHQLRKDLPRIARIDIQFKRAKHLNEMSQFRYDVVLHIGTDRPAPASVSWQDWTGEGLSLSDIDSTLSKKPACIAIAGVPNARAAEAVKTHALVFGENGLRTAGDMEQMLGQARAGAVDPEEVWALAQRQGYAARISPSAKVGCFDVILQPIDAVPVEIAPVFSETRELANDPVLGKLRRSFIPQLRRHAEERLPEYMVPAAFVLMDAVPLTHNGKIDRRALPTPDATRPEMEVAYEEAHTAVEKALAKIWADVLRLERVGIHDNFFELGGDSILSIQIIARANQAGLGLTARHVFQHQTIAELAEVVGGDSSAKVADDIVVYEAPLTPIQQWFLESGPANPNHFNMSRLLVLHQNTGIEAVEMAVSALVEQHETLRLRLTKTDQGWRQSIAPFGEGSIVEQIDLSGLVEAERGPAITKHAAQLQQSLNLTTGPVFRAAYFDLGPDSPPRLLLVMHHMAVDGVSLRVVLGDLQAALQQVEKAEAVALPAKTVTYLRWATSLHEHAQSSKLQEQMEYWASSRRHDASPTPIDFPGNENTFASQQAVRMSLEAEETKKLLQEVPAAYHTQINDILLTALVQAFAPFAGGDAFLVDMEGHGREALFDDLDHSRTLGWFTSMYPVLLELPIEDGDAAAIKAIKEQVRQIPERGIGYGLLRYLSDDENIRTELVSLPAAQISFNYHGVFDQVVRDSEQIGIAPESAGANQDPNSPRSHIIDVMGQVTDGRLQMAFLYSENLHERGTIERLAADYMHSLRGLIQHCTQSNAGGYTPSDFPKARVSQKALDALLANLPKK